MQASNDESRKRALSDVIEEVEEERDEGRSKRARRTLDERIVDALFEEEEEEEDVDLEELCALERDAALGATEEDGYDEWVQPLEMASDELETETMRMMCRLLDEEEEREETASRSRPTRAEGEMTSRDASRRSWQNCVLALRGPGALDWLEPSQRVDL